MATFSAIFVANARFSPEISSRDELALVGQPSVGLFTSIWLAAVPVVVATLILVFPLRQAYVVPIIGLALTAVLWILGVVTMQQPPPVTGG